MLHLQAALFFLTCCAFILLHGLSFGFLPWNNKNKIIGFRQLKGNYIVREGIVATSCCHPILSATTNPGNEEERKNSRQLPRRSRFNPLLTSPTSSSSNKANGNSSQQRNGRKISRYDRIRTNTQSRTSLPLQSFQPRIRRTNDSYTRWCKALKSLRSAKEVNGWMTSLVAAKQRDANNVTDVESWRLNEQDSFITLLSRCGAYQAILLFVDHLARQHIYVYNAAMTSIASLSHPNHRNREKLGLWLLKKMDEREIEPTAYTFASLFGAADGPDAALRIMRQTVNNKKYKHIKLNVEVFHSAIYACGRTTKVSTYMIDGKKAKQSDSAWQTAMGFFHQMRRKRLLPTCKTYVALLQILSSTGQVRIAMSLMHELQNTPGLAVDERAWGAALNVCAQAADYQTAIRLIREMQAHDKSSPKYCRPNLRHCSAVLKALAGAKKDQLALQTLDMMLGRQTDDSVSEENEQDCGLTFYLEPTQPDLVALNTVLAACSKAGNFNKTKELFDRIKAGEFCQPSADINDQTELISPDRISYHYVLATCGSTEVAKELVKEMRLSRRHRHGAVPPTSVTYAFAISVCQKADVPDFQAAKLFLRWADDDAVERTVFMYSSAIWTAERSRDGGATAAMELLNEMRIVGCSPNSVAYDGVISAVAKSEDKRKAETALQIFKEMKESGIQPTAVTFLRLVLAIRSAHPVNEQQSLLEQAVQTMDGEDFNPRLSGSLTEALLSIYGQKGKFDEARQLFCKLEGFATDVPCLRAMILACGSVSPPRWEEAVSLLHSSDILEGPKGNPGHMDQVAVSDAIIVCCKADEFEEALNLLQLFAVKRSDEQSVPRPRSVSIGAMNALIGACGRRGRPDVAFAVFNEIELRLNRHPDQRSYRNVVIACNQAEHEGRRNRERIANQTLTENRSDSQSTFRWWEVALSLLRRMQENNVSPDIQTFSSVISACEAAGQWQRALGVLQEMLDTEAKGECKVPGPNLYCFNAAISACEKGGAWVEALDLYERMLDQGGPLQPNFVTLNSLLVALDSAGQKTLAQSKYDEAKSLRVVNPWRITKNRNGKRTRAMDLHKYSSAMASAAIRGLMDSYVEMQSIINEDLIIVTGKGLRSAYQPVLMRTVKTVLEEEYGIHGKVDELNAGRLILERETLRRFIAEKSWI